MTTKPTDPVTALLKKMGCTILSVSSHERPVIRVANTRAVKQLEGIPVGYSATSVQYNAYFQGCDIEWRADRSQGVFARRPTSNRSVSACQ